MHFANLEQLISDFHATNPFKVTEQIDPQTHEKVYRVMVQKEIPVSEIGAVLGDGTPQFALCLGLPRL